MPSYDSRNAEESPYTLDRDAVSGIIRIAVRNFWTDEISQRFLSELIELASVARQKTPSLRVVVDASAMSVHSSAAAEEYAEADEAVYRAGDLIAVVTGSALVKMQFRRIFNRAQTEYFDTVPTAEAWLRERS